MGVELSSVFNGEFLNLSQESLLESLSKSYLRDETPYIEALYHHAYDDNDQPLIKKTTKKIVSLVREADKSSFFDIEDLLQEYSLSDADGVTLMCLAEALLRIPDEATKDAMIKDKISEKEW